MRFLSAKSVAGAIGILVVLGIGVFLITRSKPVPQEAVPVLPAVTPETPLRTTIGTSVKGRRIESFTYGNGKTRLLFVGGMHGGYEWNSVLLAYAFIDYLNEHPAAVPKNLTISIIPSLNPDGVYAVTGKEGRFAEKDASTDKAVLASGRFNAHSVDLNRNFDCKWKPTSTWQSKTVSAGSAPFSEPEATALKRFVSGHKPAAAVFWHSQANAVYASECEDGILPQTLEIMSAYAKAAGYPAVESFDAYAITGDVEGWLASLSIPAITVELKTHETVEWDKNLAGIAALLDYYSGKAE